jgi:hypothetical protein
LVPPKTKRERCGLLFGLGFFFIGGFDDVVVRLSVFVDEQVDLRLVDGGRLDEELLVSDQPNQVMRQRPRPPNRRPR